MLAWPLFLRFDDAAVGVDVDGDTLSLGRLDRADALADFVDLLVEDAFLTLAWVHLYSCRSKLGRRSSDFSQAAPCREDQVPI